VPTAGNGRNRRLPCHVVFQQVLATATNDSGLTQAEVSEDDQYDDNDTNDVKDVHACPPSAATERWMVQGGCQQVR
jgi:hypothetical protein